MEFDACVGLVFVLIWGVAFVTWFWFRGCCFLGCVVFVCLFGSVWNLVVVGIFVWVLDLPCGFVELLFYMFGML